MLRRTYTMILAVTLLFAAVSFSQTYQGPAVGTVDTGAVVNTNSFSFSPIFGDSDPIIRGEMNIDGNLEPLFIESDGKEILPSTYTEDLNVGENTLGIGDNALLLKKFKVTLDNNVIPPDPTIAVGPNHVMVLTNNGTGIRIYDKQGTLLRSINSNTFWSGVWFRQDGDPQILYDHFSGRWFMLFMQYDDVALTAGNLIAYSDDDDPLGTWYTYRLDTKLHGTTMSNTWGDYPQIGFDEQAIYIMTRCFTFAAQPQQQYTKIRIISKTELYSSNAGPLTYKDIWNIYDSSLPVNQQYPDIIHPSFQYSAAGEHYFLYAYRGGGNFYSLYKLSNPLTAPLLTRVNINVPFFGNTPDANQLGGGTPLIAANGSHIKTAPVFRDGYLYATHSIRNSVYPNYASIKYVKIDVATNTVVESAELGADKYFYIYPAIAVDKDGNVGITCSRSGDSEYIGSYYTSRRAADPPGLSSSRTLQPGLGNYIIAPGGGRNRWGDYLGAFIDPADEYSFWMISEYASGTNAYACMVGQVRLQPFEGVYTFIDNTSLSFGDIEVGTGSDTVQVTLSNYGSDDFVITNIPEAVGDFHLASSHSFPIILQTYDSIAIKFRFSPTSEGQQDTFYTITSNSGTLEGLNLGGFGFVINSAPTNNLYAISGSQNSGNFVLLDKETGAGTNIGPTFYNDLIGVTIHPTTHITYAFKTPSTNFAEIYRINAEFGNSYKLLELPFLNLHSIAFDNNGVLWAIQRSGELFTVNLDSGTYSQVSTVPVERVTMAFDPISNDLWGSVRNTASPRDLIIKINPLTGDTTLVGPTGFNANTTEIAFDENGILYGVKGIGAVAVSDLFTIDKTTGTGTIIGSIGLKDIRGIAYSLGEPNSVIDNIASNPTTYSLEQNYPNPFNPSTQIKFALPVNSSVRITIYNLLGEVVRELVNTDMNSGVHTVQWNAEDVSGRKISSGIYFYELNANGINGNQFNQVRKMILMK